MTLTPLILPSAQTTTGQDMQRFSRLRAAAAARQHSATRSCSSTRRSAACCFSTLASPASVHPHPAYTSAEIPSPFQPAAPAAPFTAPDVAVAAAVREKHKQQARTRTPPPHSSSYVSTRLLHPSYDVVIVGGGMVGSALALSLASNPTTRHLKVCVIEGAMPKLDAALKPEPSVRVSAVTPKSAAFFERMSAWERMCSARVSKYVRMRVWHASERGVIEWNKNQIDGESTRRVAQPSEDDSSSVPDTWQNVDAALVPPPSSALGFIVENDVLQTSLWQQMGELITRARNARESASASTAAVSDDHECNLEILSPVKIEQILPGHGAAGSTAAAGNDWPRLLLSNDQAISARLLVGADGPSSMVKQYAGSVENVGWEYNQRAVVATLKLESETPREGTAQATPAQPSAVDSASSSSASSSSTSPAALPLRTHTAYQRFLPWGPIAFLPCHAGYASLVWSTTPAHAALLTASSTSPEDFVSMVNSAFRRPGQEFGVQQPESKLPGPLGVVADVLFPRGSPTAASSSSGQSAPESDALPPLVSSVVGPRLSFPLRFLHSSSYVTPRVALVGDAAHVIHPLAGQGVNLGFGDAEALSAVIATAVEAGADVGTIESLRPYESAQLPVNAGMMMGIDSVGKFFRVTDGPLAWARAVGMDLFNAVPAIKNRVAEVAMGLKKKQ